MLSVQAALGLVFDARYRDFPFAPLTGAVVPFLLMASSRRGGCVPTPRRRKPRWRHACLSAVYIVFNESFANWQALWFCAGLIALALTLLQERAAPG